jgi:hypothetical protein
MVNLLQMVTVEQWQLAPEYFRKSLNDENKRQRKRNKRRQKR